MEKKRLKDKLLIGLITILIIGIIVIGFLMIKNQKEASKNIGQQQNGTMQGMDGIEINPKATMTDSVVVTEK